MFDLKERPYPGHMLINFWCDSDNNKLHFGILGDISVFILGNYQNLVI